MLRRWLIVILSGLFFALAADAQPGPGLFGDRRWRAPIANAGALPDSAALGEVRLTLDDGALYFWDGDSWESASGAGSGEANTASSLGGGLTVYDSKLGVDLRFNSLAAADFNLAANVLSIDDAVWAKDADIPADTNAGTICAGTTTYLDGEGTCDDLALVYSVLAHGHVLSALSGAVTDDQVPNNVTIDFAAAAGGAPPAGAAGGDLGGSYPDPIVDDDGHAHTEATLPAASTAGAGLVELATDGEATGGLAVQGNDSRLSNARAPTAHASSHANGGADEVSVAGLSGQLADGQTPLSHAASHQDGGADEISAAALSGQLADAQKITVRKNTGADVGTRSRLNLVEGSNVTLTITDDSGSGEVDVTIAAAGGGVTDHGALTGLADDDHTQYVATAGRSGGTTVTGGTGAGDALTLRPNSANNTGSIKFARGLDGALILELYNAGGARFYKNAIPDNDAGATVGFAETPSATHPTLRPTASDGDTGIGWTASNQLSLVAGGSEIARLTRSAVSTSLDIGQGADTPQAVTCIDSGDGNPGALTINPTTSLVHVTNSDADGCAVTLGESNLTSGVRVEIIVTSTAGGSVAFADTAGVTELAGAFSAGLYDVLSLRYISDRWVETGRSDN